MINKADGIILLLLALLLLDGNSALANEGQLPLRSDSGLIKTEQLLLSGKYTAALESADNVIQRHSNSADAYVYKGYAYYKLGEYKTAEKYFKQALNIDPSHLGANKYIGSLYVEAGKTGRALEQLQVIRMVCGGMDCEEQRLLEYEIDQYKAKKK